MTLLSFWPKKFDDPDRVLRDLTKLPESTWCERGEKSALALFHSMAQRVPAYKDFLHKKGINYKKIVTIEDFQQVPLLDKDNYLQAYPREMLCWDGDLKGKSWVFSTTSGSTGVPYYFPRQQSQDECYALTAELYLRQNFQIDKKSTLYIVGFPMGTWIGGVFTYQALEMIARRKGYRLSIITPGIDKKAIIEAVRQLGHDFDQVIIGSYAPFLKDILDDGEREGLQWKRYNLGFVFSAEIFSEEFRDYVIRKTGLKNPYTPTLNHYGTVDLGTMAHETPLSIWVRRFALKDKALYYDIFGETYKLPTLAQYMPHLFYFEVVDDERLVCSSNSGLPLVRYDLKDRGGVFTLDQLRQVFIAHGYNLDEVIPKKTVGRHAWNLPFVFVYERSDLSVSFFAFQVYPDTVRRALHLKSLEKKLTGKFTMLVTYDDQGRQKLIINLECKQGHKIDSTTKERIIRRIIRQLTAENSEYRVTRKEYGKITDPEVIFWPYEHEQFFKPGTKQKWVHKGDVKLVKPRRL
jgi:phenylacetate-CoA ligase